MGAGRIRSSKGVRHLIDYPLLCQLCDADSYLIGDLFHATLLGSMFLIAFQAFLRASEFMIPAGKSVSTAIQLSDCKFPRTGESSSIAIIMRHFKGNNRGVPFTLNIIQGDNF